MALKPDEKFVSESLIKYFGSSNTTYQEGENPPDIYLIKNKEKIAVEITRLSPATFDDSGNMQNRNTQDMFGVNLCNELDSKLKSKLPKEIDLFLAIYLPVQNPRKYKKELYKLIESELGKNIKIGDKKTTCVLGHKVKINFIPNRSHSDKKIVGTIVNDNSNAHILSNAIAILSERIIEKDQKCKNIQHTGSKWLALLNDYWLADNGVYSQAMESISLKHDFHKILLVTEQGLVSELSET